MILIRVSFLAKILAVTDTEDFWIIEYTAPGAPSDCDLPWNETISTKLVFHYLHFS